MNQEKMKGRPSSTLIIGVIVVLLIVIGWLLYDRSQQKQKTEEIISELKSTNSDKASVTLQFENLLSDYEYLKTDNDSINTHLTREREKIKTLIHEMKTVKSTNASRISEYKRQLSKLRRVMRGYIVQIDSLNTLTQELTAENKKVKSNYRKVEAKSKKLSSKNKELNSKVEVASVVKAINIHVSALNKRGRPTKKARKMKKLKVCFTLNENAIAKEGIREVFIRVADPNGVVLAKGENLFTLDDEEIAFSSKKDVNYQNSTLDECIFWDKDRNLPKGKYSVDIFMDGNQVGTGNVYLK